MWFCLTGAAVGTAVAALGMAASQFVSVDFSSLDADVVTALVRLNRPEVGCAVGITLGSLWLAFRPPLRLLPRL